MNPLFRTTFMGTLGELIAQTHLLAHGVQAAPPVKDSGNDLIAVRGEIFRAVQVKTSKDGTIRRPNERKLYHVLAVVHLPFDGKKPLIQNARLFLFPVTNVRALRGTVDDYPDALVSDSLILQLWPDTQNAVPPKVRGNDHAS